MKQNEIKQNLWEIPEELKEIQLSSFPIECFPVELKNYAMALAEELQVAVDMVATGILAVCSLCNQGKYLVEGKKGWLEPLNVYALNIAKPSERKSPIIRKLITPILQYEAEENERRKMAVFNSKSELDMYHNKLQICKNKYGKQGQDDNKTMQEMREINEKIANHSVINFIRLIVDDITPEALVSVMIENQEKIGIFSAEGGIFETMAGRYNNNIVNCDLILKAYSGDRVSVDRKNREAETMNNPCITILLFVQPTIVENIFSNKEFNGRGLCARFLYCFPHSKVGSRNVNSEEIPSILSEQYNAIIKKLLKNQKDEVQIIKLSEEAKQVSQEFAADLEKKLVDELEEIEEWAGKLHGTILRIAANLHLIENSSEEPITAATMKKAIEIGNYYIKHTLKVYNLIGVDADIIKAKKIIKIIKKRQLKGSIKKHKLFRDSRGTMIEKIEDIKKPLDILIEMGYIREIIPEYEGIGRKPDTILELNPLVFK